MMNIQSDNLLANYVTMKIGGPAKMIIKVETEAELKEACQYAKENNLAILTLGNGTNIIFKDSGYDGLVILNRICSDELDVQSGKIEVSSGENWDSTVQRILDNNLCGVESMSFIPGLTGATPINNVGAYGQEIKDTLESVRAFNINSGEFVEFSNRECDFSYRNSRFKSYDYGNYVITKIRLQLSPTPEDYKVPEYKSVIEKLETDGIRYPKPIDVRQALKTIRTSKLPDPSRLANTGSFFKNPIVAADKAQSLLANYPELPTYPQTDGTVKLAAGWMIEKAGLKGMRKNGIWVYDQQALVLVNESAKSFNDLESTYKHIIDVVNYKFGVTLEPEPEII